MSEIRKNLATFFLLCWCSLPIKGATQPTICLNYFKALGSSFLQKYQSKIADGVQPLLEAEKYPTIHLTGDPRNIIRDAFGLSDVQRFATFQHQLTKETTSLSLIQSSPSDGITNTTPSAKFRLVGLEFLIHQAPLELLESILKNGIQPSSRRQRTFLSARSSFSVYHPELLKDLSTSLGFSAELGQVGQALLIFSPEILDDFKDNHFISYQYGFGLYGLTNSSTFGVPVFYDAILRAIKEQEQLTNEIVLDVSLPLTFLVEILIPDQGRDNIHKLPEAFKTKIKFIKPDGTVIL